MSTNISDVNRFQRKSNKHDAVMLEAEGSVSTHLDEKANANKLPCGVVEC